MGHGVPDLLVGYRGLTYLMEVKDGTKSPKDPNKSMLTPDQINWHQAWKGKPVAVVKSLDDALQVLGLR